MLRMDAAERRRLIGCAAGRAGGQG
jgi:hypothetical protein